MRMRIGVWYLPTLDSNPIAMIVGNIIVITYYLVVH